MLGLVEKRDLLIKICSKPISGFDWLSNCLQILKFLALLVKRGIFSITVNPICSLLKCGEELVSDGGIDEVLIVTILSNLILHVINIRLQIVLGFLNVKQLSVSTPNFILNLSQFFFHVWRDGMRDCSE